MLEPLTVALVAFSSFLFSTPCLSPEYWPLLHTDIQFSALNAPHAGWSICSIDGTATNKDGWFLQDGVGGRTEDPLDCPFNDCSTSSGETSWVCLRRNYILNACQLRRNLSAFTATPEVPLRIQHEGSRQSIPHSCLPYL